MAYSEIYAIKAQEPNFTGVTEQEVIEKLRNEYKYTIEQETTSTSITSISADTTNVLLVQGKNSGAITITPSITPNNVAANYVKLKGMYYKIIYSNSKIELGEGLSEIPSSGSEEAFSILSATSNNESVAKVTKTTNTVTITGEGKGTATIIVKYTDSIKTEISVTVIGSLVGHYADIDGNDTVDGIIYADLLVDGGKSGTWGSVSTYTLPTINEASVKTYVDTGVEHTENGFGTSTIIKLDPSNTGTEDRFYVMGLTDIKDNANNSKLYWYKNAYQNMSDWSSVTSTAFGSGKTNTENIKAKCTLTSTDDGYYGEVDSRDLWAYVPSGWFIPSKDEWTAFAKAFGITSSNYSSTFGLSNYYWSSSQNGALGAWRTNFRNVSIGVTTVNFDFCVRVSSTF